MTLVDQNAIFVGRMGTNLVFWMAFLHHNPYFHPETVLSPAILDDYRQPYVVC